jgi:hypothetical protein
MSARRITPDSGSYPKRPYDLVREVTIGFGVVLTLSLILAAVFSSPDRPALTLASWAKTAPDDVVATAVGELAGSTTSAGYGPPYNDAGPAQKIASFAPARWLGVTQPLDAADDLVIGPLRQVHADASLATALSTWSGASPDQQTTWASAYADAIAADTTGLPPVLPKYGPVPQIARSFEQAAASGLLDGVLAPSTPLGNDTRRLMLLADGSYMADQAQADHLSGDQWGMMNEAGNYPGQPWLWLYTFWYQVPAIANSPNADLIVTSIMAALTVALICVPFIPGLRSLPRLLGVHRLIWRSRARTLVPSSSGLPPL